MSTNNNNKNGSAGGDWDAALEEWDQSPLGPARPQDNTKPGDEVEDPSAPAAPSVDPDIEALPTIPPDAVGDTNPPDQDEERTIVGDVPLELLADSIRGFGSTSGLGQIFDRGPAKPDGSVDVVLDEDPSVVTSAPDVGGAVTPPEPGMPRPAKLDEGQNLDVADGEMFDPFADLHGPGPIGSKPGAPPRPPPPASVPRPGAALSPQPLPTPEPLFPPAQSEAALPPAEPFMAERLLPEPPIGSEPPPVVPESERPPPNGPKLIAPSVRQYPTDEVTAVFGEDPPLAMKIAQELVGTQETDDQTVVDEFPPALTPAAIQPEDPTDPEAQPQDMEAMAPLPSRVPPPPVAESPQWTDERDVASYLLEAGSRDAWETRAAWLAEEAVARKDPAERSRIMLTVSECCALLGDDEKAAAVANAARDLAPSNPLVQRQSRHVSLRDRKWSETLAQLEAETRAAPTPDARVHGTLMGAELAAHVGSDRDAMAKQLEIAARVLPADPRAHVAKLALALTESETDIPAPRWPESEELSALLEGAMEVRRIREAPTRGGITEEKMGRYEALPRARAALAAGHDTAAASHALRVLHDVRGIGPGATWLSATFAAQSPGSRADSMVGYKDLIAGPHAATAHRLITLRAVEANEAEAVTEALNVPGSAAFTPTDRVALSALFRADPSPTRPFMSHLLTQPETAAFGAAAISALEPATGDESSNRMAAVAIGSDASKTAATLARHLASGADPSEFGERVEAYREANPHAPAGRLLDVECDIEGGSSERLIEEIAGWAGGGEGSEADRDRAIAAGLIAELMSDAPRAQQEYERALSAEPGCESAARAIRTFDNESFAGRLLDLARGSHDDIKASILALEAALLEGGEDEDSYEERLRLARQLAPALPFAGFLGERSARSRGDIDGVLDWIRSRRESTVDPLESAYDLCREAMLMVERDAAFSATLLTQASATRPFDVALRDLYERFAPERPDDWVSWRVARAAELGSPEGGRWLLEAALELERTGGTKDAAKLAQRAVELGAPNFARLCLERCELAGAGTTAITDGLMEQARDETASTTQRREARERLAELDEAGRGDLASALLWHRAILEEMPGHLPSLRRIEHAYIGDGRDQDLEPIASELTTVLEGGEMDAHASLAARMRLKDGEWSETRELVECAAAAPRPSLWALRESLAHARAQGDTKVLVAVARTLSERSDRESEGAALLVHAADALAREGQPGDAHQMLQIAMEREPSLADAHFRLIEILQECGEHARAAEELEVLARKSNVPAHQAQLWSQAATLWLDKVEDTERGRASLEEASDIDITFEGVFERLQAIYIQDSARTELAALLERRLEGITDPAERMAMEVLRGRALADVGELGAAKQALAAALDADPDHVPALETFAELSIKEDDWSGAEQSLIRLGRLVPDVDQQAEIYRRLADIYLDHLPDMDRAELALREVLDRKPEDSDAQSRLVDVFRKTGDAAKAVELCTTLLQSAGNPDEKRKHTIQLALIHEQVEGDVAKAQKMLEQVFKQSSTNVHSMRALAEFYVRQDQQPALRMLLDRAINDARRSLRTGRFNPDLFAVVETVSELRGHADGALGARAALLALDGEGGYLGVAGPRAMAADLDEFIAPPAINSSFRALLRQMGHVLDAAIPVDLKALRANPLPASESEIDEVVQSYGAGAGLTRIEAHVSPALGPTCMPVSSSPPRIVLGGALVSAEDKSVRDFLIARAIKIVQTRATVLSRTAPIDLLPMICAFIKTLAPSYTPGEVDKKRFEEHLERIGKEAPGVVPPEVSALALELSASLDNRASMLNTAVNSWGDRAALLAFGAAMSGLQAIAWAGGHPSGPPASGRERVTWIGRNAEGRELIVFLVSEEFLEVRSRLGLAEG